MTFIFHLQKQFELIFENTDHNHKYLYFCLGDPFDIGQLENMQVIESAQLGDSRGRRVHRLGVRDVVAVAHAHSGSLAGPELAPAQPGAVELSTITIKTENVTAYYLLYINISCDTNQTLLDDVIQRFSGVIKRFLSLNESNIEEYH